MFEPDFVQKGLDLCKGQMTMALKRDAGPHATTVAALANLANLLTTAALMDIIAGQMSRSEAIAKMRACAADMVEAVAGQTEESVRNMDIPQILEDFNEAHPDKEFKLHERWED